MCAPFFFSVFFFFFCHMRVSRRCGFFSAPSLLARAGVEPLPSDFVLPSPLPASSSPTDLSLLWICCSCGFSSPRTLASCPRCSAPSRVLSLPLQEKTRRGASLLRSSESALGTRLAVHAVAVEGHAAFGEKNAASLSHAVRCYNFVRVAAEEEFHAGGFDADLVRAWVLRLWKEGKKNEAREIAGRVPELFVHQSEMEGVPGKSLVGPKKGGRMGHAKELFVDWSKEGEWNKQGKTVLHPRGEEGCIVSVSEFWERQGTRSLDHKWVFDTEAKAAKFLQEGYAELCDELPLMANTLHVGTDCVSAGAVAERKGDKTIVFLDMFREQNVVCKFGLIKQTVRGATREALGASFDRCRIDTYLMARKVQQHLEKSSAVQNDSSLIERFLAKKA